MKKQISKRKVEMGKILAIFTTAALHYTSRFVVQNNRNHTQKKASSIEQNVKPLH